MREELKDKEVLAMYDIRGIQSYIFKSNLAKEIIGASKLVDNIIINGLEKCVGKENKEYLIDWKNDDPQRFLKDKNIQMQVMFIGGGNAYVLFRKGSICEEINKSLARYVLRKTYSLNLAVAVVEKTDSYKKDYEDINEEMRRIKAHMPLSQPMGALPFMAVDTITGYPLTTEEIHSANETEYICTEAKLKRNKFPKNEDEKLFDNMVTEKGDNSTLAVCHIDGNSMGKLIKDIMSEKPKYKEAIEAMRTISREISDGFRQTFEAMEEHMEKLSPKVREKRKGKLYRKIIVAGDDITFVCNAKLAIPAVEYFLKHIGDKKVKEGKIGCFSACAGIAYFNSHFPFSDAYQVAEACCSQAKNRAKSPENLEKGGKVGNFFDYQICTNVSAADVGAYRKKHYMIKEGLFIARPYHVSNANENKKDASPYSVERFHYWLDIINKMPRSKAKQLRDTISMGLNEIEKDISFLKSRGYVEFEKAKNEYPIWYDALEMMDFSLEEGGTNENRN